MWYVNLVGVGDDIFVDVRFILTMWYVNIEVM